jgi:hypothetical protein
MTLFQNGIIYIAYIEVNFYVKYFSLKSEEVSYIIHFQYNNIHTEQEWNERLKILKNVWHMNIYHN